MPGVSSQKTRLVEFHPAADTSFVCLLPIIGELWAIVLSHKAGGKGDTYMQQIKPNGKQIIAQATPQVVYCLSILWPLAQAPLPIRAKVSSLWADA